MITVTFLLWTSAAHNRSACWLRSKATDTQTQLARLAASTPDTRRRHRLEKKSKKERGKPIGKRNNGGSWTNNVAALLEKRALKRYTMNVAFSLVGSSGQLSLSFCLCLSLSSRVSISISAVSSFVAQRGALFH